jgi:hypothetical protein
MKKANTVSGIYSVGSYNPLELAYERFVDVFMLSFAGNPVVEITCSWPKRGAAVGLTPRLRYASSW